VALSEKSEPAFGCLVAVAVILIISSSLGKVYNNNTLCVLDVWFTLNLMVTAYVIHGKLSSNEAEYGLVILFTLSFVTFCGIIFYHVYMYSTIGKYFLQKWHEKVTSYKKMRIRSEHETVEQIFEGSQKNEQDKVTSTECYIELREPLLENSDV